MKLIIFDCDGVLVNSEEIYLAAGLAFLNNIVTTFEPDALHAILHGTCSRYVGQEKLRPAIESKEIGEALPPDFFERLDAFTKARMERELTALPEARHTIERISMLRCVASSTPSGRLRWKLERAGLVDLFEPHIFSSDMVENGKPAPDVFIHAAAIMEVSPDQCIVVEDSANGVLAGRAAGMRVIGFTGGNHCPTGYADILFHSGADLIVGSYADLKSAIESLCAAAEGHEPASQIVRNRVRNRYSARGTQVLDFTTRTVSGGAIAFGTAPRNTAGWRCPSLTSTADLSPCGCASRDPNGRTLSQHVRDQRCGVHGLVQPAVFGCILVEFLLERFRQGDGYADDAHLR